MIAGEDRPNGIAAVRFGLVIGWAGEVAKHRLASSAQWVVLQALRMSVDRAILDLERLCELSLSD